MKRLLASLVIGLLSQVGFAHDGGQAAQQADAQGADSIIRLQQRCQAFSAHDQIKQFQVKVNFKGYFVIYQPVTSCYAIPTGGAYQLGISMKSNRFQTQTLQGKLAAGQLNVSCTDIKAKKIQIKADSPHLTLQLDSCDQLNKDTIQALLFKKVQESYQGDPEMFSVDDWKSVNPEACAGLRGVAEKISESACQG